MAEFEVGDVVHLNSGSPRMTIEKVNADTVDVVWVGGLDVQRLTLSPDCLTSVQYQTAAQTRTPAAGN